MTDVKISALTAAVSLAATSEFAINEAGTTKKVNGGQIQELTGTAVDSLAALKALTTRPPMVIVKGKTAVYDGWGGVFVWVLGSSTTADDALVVQCTTGTAGRYKRLVSGLYNARWWGAKGDGATDDTTAIQAAADACGSNSSDTTGFGTRRLFFPMGDYKITASIVLKRALHSIVGESMFGSRILFAGVTGGCFVADASLTQIEVEIGDLCLNGDSSSGPGIDFAPMGGFNVADSSFHDLMIYTNGPCIRGYSFFSCKFDKIYGSSLSNHCFWIFGNNTTNLENLYALRAGTSKAGFRLTGQIVMIACNGLNQGDFWGIFGSNTGASDGYQGDFPRDSYPSIEMINCNVEDWATGAGASTASAIYLQNGPRFFEMKGGGFVRSAGTAYHSVVRASGSAQSTPGEIRLAVGVWDIGAGTPSGAALFTQSNNRFVDVGGVLAAAGTTTYLFNGTSSTYPTIQEGSVLGGLGPYKYFSNLSADNFYATASIFDSGGSGYPVYVQNNNNTFGGIRFKNTSDSQGYISYEGTNWVFYSANAVVFQFGPSTLGFFGHAGAAKPTVSGSRGGNAALASLLTALAGLGLLTDSSS